MILRELFYFDRKTAETVQDNSYIASRDTSSMDINDTRKTRLTLGQINELRKANEQHDKDQAQELDFINRMYATKAEELQQ